MVLSEGRPVPVLAGQDHATRLMEDAMYLHSREVKGMPVDPQAVQVIQKHMMEHMQYLKQTQPAAVKQVLAQLQQIENAPAPGKVTQMPGQTEQPQLTQGQPQPMEARL